MTKEFSPYEGAFFLPEDVTLADIWMGLHADATSFHKASDAPGEQAVIDQNSLSLLKVLADCPAPRWAALIDGLGATQTGAIALSWCADATLADVAALFSRTMEHGAPFDARAASLLCPRHGAAERQLSKLVTLAEQDITSLVLLCLGDPRPLVFDVDGDWLDALPAPVTQILRMRAGTEDTR